MPVEALSLGMPWTMIANRVYALPGVNATLFTDAAAPTITTSNTLAFTTSSPITLVGGAARVSGAFIKAASDTLVVLKRD